MKRFLFPLERLFHFRTQLERQRGEALAGAMREEEQRRRVLEDAAAHLDRCRDQLAEAAGSVAPAGALHNLAMTVRAAASHAGTAGESHLTSMENVGAEQDRFGQARMERRVVERLRDRRHSDWTVEQSREEQKDLDEGARRRRKTGEST